MSKLFGFSTRVFNQLKRSPFVVAYHLPLSKGGDAIQVSELLRTVVLADAEYK